MNFFNSWQLTVEIISEIVVGKTMIQKLLAVLHITGPVPKSKIINHNVNGKTCGILLYATQAQHLCKKISWKSCYNNTINVHTLLTVSQPSEFKNCSVFFQSKMSGITSVLHDPTFLNTVYWAVFSGFGHVALAFFNGTQIVSFANIL